MSKPITFVDFISAMCWTNPEKHLAATIYHNEAKDIDEQFEDIEITVANVAKYSDYIVSDIDIVDNATLYVILQGNKEM